MDSLIQWLSENWAIVFSGVGTTIVAAIVGFILKRKSSDKPPAPVSQAVVSGDGSTNIQAGDNAQINIGAPEAESSIKRATFDEIKKYDPKTRSLLRSIKDIDKGIAHSRVEVRRGVLAAHIALSVIILWLVALWILTRALFCRSAHFYDPYNHSKP